MHPLCQGELRDGRCLRLLPRGPTFSVQGLGQASATSSAKDGRCGCGKTLLALIFLFFPDFWWFLSNDYRQCIKLWYRVALENHSALMFVSVSPRGNFWASCRIPAAHLSFRSNCRSASSRDRWDDWRGDRPRDSWILWGSASWSDPATNVTVGASCIHHWERWGFRSLTPRAGRNPST